MFRKCVFALPIGLLSAAVFLAAASPVSAVPILQTYLEGGEYDPITESWTLTPLGSSGGAPFRIWTIGNVSGPGGKGTIEDVRLSISYDKSFDLTISLTPSTTGGLGGFIDTSTPIAPIQNGVLTPIRTSLGDVSSPVVTNGGVPVLGDGANLPTHGVFGADTVWQEFSLGDFSSSDSPIADFIGEFPTDLTSNAGQINVYEVSVLGGSGATIHFDLYDHVMAGNHAKYKFAPFSHDADANANVVPEPGSIAVWSLLGLFGVIRRRR